MTIDVSCGNALETPTDLLVLPHWQDAKRYKGILSDADKLASGTISSRAARKGYRAKMNEALFTTPTGSGAEEVMVFGAGEKKYADADTLRLSGAHILKRAEAARARTVCIPLEFLRDSCVRFRDAVSAFAEGMFLAGYQFRAYHGAQKKKENGGAFPDRVTFVVSTIRDARIVEEAVLAAKATAEAVIAARDLVNTPSADMTPSVLADIALSLADRASGISCEIITAERMERMGMHATCAVGRGSEHPPVGVHLTYAPKGKGKRSVAVIGKAVTFDSGGLSIKPSKGMETMKIDMAGAAAVIGLFTLLRTLRPDVTVHGIFLGVENMPGGSAYRPGDVVTAMDGTTIEVLNTDAEGRLTLADALAYAAEQAPDMIIDLATLTGACVAALGEDIAAVFSNDARLAKRVQDAGADTGEQVWELPLYPPYAKHNASKIADLKNLPSGSGAGAITAALFLKPFVRDIPWAHLDIAGPSYAERDSRPDIPYGGTGFGVRLLARFLQRL